MKAWRVSGQGGSQPFPSVQHVPSPGSFSLRSAPQSHCHMSMHLLDLKSFHRSTLIINHSGRIMFSQLLLWFRAALAVRIPGARRAAGCPAAPRSPHSSSLGRGTGTSSPDGPSGQPALRIPAPTAPGTQDKPEIPRAAHRPY